MSIAVHILYNTLTITSRGYDMHNKVTQYRKPKPNNKKTIIPVDDPTTALLINEGCRLDKEKKDIESKLAGIKTELEMLEVGKYKTDIGSIVTVSESDSYSAIDPAGAKALLRSKRLGKNFLSCVKVSVTDIKRHLSEEELETLRGVTGVIRKYSFK